MQIKYSVPPNYLKEDYRYLANVDEFLPITIAYIGKYTYEWNTHIDTGLEFSLPSGFATHNFHVGNFCSIAENMSIFIGHSHNFRNISTGSVYLLGKSFDKKFTDSSESHFNQKSSIVIQNDVWIGDSVTIMPNVIVHNGACIAKNSHVVKDVPPFAIVGGNPAHVIGYRYKPEQIEKLQKLQWWYWNTDTILNRIESFNEDPDEFYSLYCSDALANRFKDFVQKPDNYFAFVDFYENYPAYPSILKQFITFAHNNSNAKLILFVQEEYVTDSYTKRIQDLIHDIHSIDTDPSCLCSVDIILGSKTLAENTISCCSNYIMSRTYDTVYFTCISDLLGIQIISGTDGKINFRHEHNMIK